MRREAVRACCCPACADEPEAAASMLVAVRGPGMGVWMGVHEVAMTMGVLVPMVVAA